MQGGTQIAVGPENQTVMVYPSNPILGKNLLDQDLYWPQVMVGQFDANGVPLGPYKSAPTQQLMSQGVYWPDVAIGPESGVLAYYDDTGLAWGSPGHYDVNYQMLDATGRPTSNIKWAGGGQDLTDHPDPVRVAMNHSGAFVITWTFNPFYVYYYVRARLFDANGNPTGDVFTVSTGDINHLPVVGLDDVGRAVFAYQASSDGDQTGIMARRYDSTGSPLGAPFVVNSYTLGAQVAPEIAVGADGSFVIVWSGQGDLGNGVFFRRFDAAGMAIGIDVRVAMGATSGAHIGMAADGSFVISWQQAGGVFAQRFAANGSVIGGPWWVDQGTSTGVDTAELAVAANGDLVICWTESGGATKARWLTADAPGDALPYGPSVVALSPTILTTASLTTVSVTFDRAVNLSSFTPDDVGITDPVGRSVTASQVTSSDNVNFTITFPTQHIAGIYNITIGPTVLDLNGQLMDQDGDATNGESTDAFANQITIVSPSPAAALPLLESFDAGSIDLVGSYWSFARTAGIIRVVSTAHSPAYSLQMIQASYASPMTQDAILRLDLLGGSHVTLDFWGKHYSNDIWGNQVSVAISTDGVAWQNITSFITAYVYPIPWEHRAFALDTLGLSYSSNTLIRFRQTASYNDGYVWDDIRVAQNLDVFGARVVSQIPIATVNGPVSSLQVTFNEPISSFPASAVKVTGPAGNTVDLALANPVMDSGDHQTFTINFATPTSLGGHYLVSVGPNVLDLVGNEMNQNNDALQGDGYSGSFDLRAQPATPPVAEGFEAGGLNALASWSAAVNTGGLSVSGTNPEDGTSSLQFSRTDGQFKTGYYQEAILHVDLLDGTVPATGCVLDLWLKEISGGGLSNDFTVSFSTSGTTWTTPAELVIAGSSVYQHYVFNMDSLGLTYTHDVQIKFHHDSYYGGGFALDGVRVRTHALPPNHAPTLTTVAILSGALVCMPYAISYDALAAAANEADVDGNPLSFRVMSVTGGTLTKNGVAVTPGTTLLGPGEWLKWMPSGTGATVVAFTVRAWDGDLNSGTTVPVNVAVTAVGLYAANMDVDPGWTFSPGSGNYRWEWGHPLGQGGDPASGHTGSNVIGYNLSGQYPNSMSRDTPPYR